MANKAKAQIQLGADYNGSQAIRKAIEDLKKLDAATKKSAVKNIKIQLQQAKAQRAASIATAKADKNLQRQAKKAYKEQLAWEKKARVQRGSSRASGRYQSDGFGNSRRKTGVSEYTMTQGGSWAGTGTRGMRGRGKYMRAQVKAERDYTTQMKAFVAEKKKQAKQRKQVEQMQRWGVTPGRWTGVGASVRGRHANAGAGKRHYSSYAGLLHTGSNVKSYSDSTATKKATIQKVGYDPKGTGGMTGNLYTAMSKFLSVVGVLGIVANTLQTAANMLISGASGYLSIVSQGVALRDEFAGDVNRAMAMTNGDYTKAYDLTNRGYQHAMESRMNSADYMNTFARFNMAYSGWKNEEEAFTFTDTVAKALAVGGAESGEVSSVMLQLSQAFNKGNLNGDELRSISENSYILRDAIQKQVLTKLANMEASGEITAEQYQKYSDMGLVDLGANGLITADDIVKAVLGKTSMLDDLFEKSAWNTGQMKENLWTSVKMAFNNSGLNNGMTEVYKELMAAMPSVTSFVEDLFGALNQEQIPALVERIKSVASDLDANKDHYIQGIQTIINILGKAFDIAYALITTLLENFSTEKHMGRSDEILEDLQGTPYEITGTGRNGLGEGQFTKTTPTETATADFSDVEQKANEATAAVQEVETTSAEVAATSSATISATSDEATTWGTHLSENYASGIRAGIEQIRAAAEEAAAAAAGPLHQTVADYGPLAHTDEWGGHLVENIATGIMDNADMLAKASNYLANKESTGIKDSMAENFRNSLMNNWYRNTNNHTFTSNISFGDINNGMNPKQVINEIENFLEEAMASAVVS